MHPLLNLEPDDRLELTPTVKKLQAEYAQPASWRRGLEKNGQRHRAESDCIGGIGESRTLV
jgi:hypothetical protein